MPQIFRSMGDVCVNRYCTAQPALRNPHSATASGQFQIGRQNKGHDDAVIIFA